MGIQALPDTTVRTLGATQALTDASTVVKELIDNSLDANATSISIEIHSNTLDFIQVRDNGSGVAPEDRPLVARRYCTSKITHDDELKDIGGSSLGFRGEALASAAELSGSLTISTRIEGEPVATALKIDRKGEVISQGRASLPVGTTVRITDFIKANPVRRQNALKNTEKCLKNIKRLLQAYAFARYNVRFSLRVAKSKKAVGDWIYAPKSCGNAEDAAFKIVGAVCASQCTWSVIEEHGFTLQAFLPRPDAELSKISNTGYFISVDARPVSSSAGSFKQITKIFREAMKEANSQFEGVKDPFLYLETECPVGSYDVNLEPSKNDVLFEDNAVVIAAARKLFQSVYVRSEQAHHETPSVALIGHNDRSHEDEEEEEIPTANFEFSAAVVEPPRRLDPNQTNFHTPQPLPEHEDNRRRSPAHEDEGLEMAPVQNYRTTMYGCDEDDLDLYDESATGRSEADYEELRQARKDVTISNPWILAKLNTSVRNPLMSRAVEDSPQGIPGIELPSSPFKRLQPQQHAGGTTGLPTPRPSSPSPPADDFHTPRHGHNFDLGSTGRVAGPPDLPTPQPYTPVPSSDMHVGANSMSDDQGRRAQPTYNYAPMESYMTAPPFGTPFEATPDRAARPKARQQPRGPVNKPFKPPMMEQPQREKVWFDHLEQVDRPRAQRRKQPQPSSDGLVSQGEFGNDAPRPLSPPRRNRDIRDFVGPQNTDSVAAMIESRNYGRATAQRDIVEHETPSAGPDKENQSRVGVLGGRDFVPASDLAALEAYASSPEKQRRRVSKRRRTSDRRLLQDMSANAPLAEQDEPAPIDEQDTSDAVTRKRAVSRRRSSHKLGRTKSSKLPLERVPAGQRTHNLLHVVPISAKTISQLAGKIDEDASLLSYNQPSIPVHSVYDSEQLDLHKLTNNLHDFLITAGADTEHPGPENLFNEVQAAFAQRRIADEDIDRGETLSNV